MSALPPTGATPSENLGPLPRVFGRYVLFDRIGRGGMADIFLARADTGLGGSRLCVVKQILPEFSQDRSFEQMLVAEAKLAARLTHANIVQVFDLGREGDRLFIAMEYVEGFDLNQLLRALSQAKVGLSSEFAIYIVREVLRGLDYAHRQRDPSGKPLGIVHRDVSPSNVLVSFEGEVRLCDFGIARALSAANETAPADSDSADGPAARHKVVGKSAYMSPEHARGEAVDVRSDVFAAGILLWELCAGRRLYRGSEDEMLAAAKKADIPPVPAERKLVAQPLMQALLDKALAVSPAARFQSAQEFLQALEDYAATARQLVSQLRFGAFLTEQFGARIIETRREREHAVRHVPSELPPPVHPRTRTQAAHISVIPDASSASRSQPPSSDFKLPSSASIPLSEAAAEAVRAHQTPESPRLLTPLQPQQDSTSVTLDGLPQLRVWSEPGLDDLPAALGSVEAALSAQQRVDQGVDLLGTALSPGELEHSLSGIAALDPGPAAHTPAEHVAQVFDRSVGRAQSERAPPRGQHPSQAPAPRTRSEAPAARPARSSPPSAPAVEREWVWYLAALLILALGVVGYFWR